MTDCVYFLLYLALGKLSLMLLVNYYYYYYYYKVSHKSSSKHYNFFNIATFIFESRVLFGDIVCQTMYVPGTSW